MARKIKWRVKAHPKGGWTGTIVLPAGRAVIPVAARGATPEKALSTAAGLAESLLDSPILKAALPPGSGAAIEAVKMISKYAGKGLLKKGMKLLKGKGAKRIAKSLKKLKFW